MTRNGRTSMGVWYRQRPDTAAETKSENGSVCRKTETLKVGAGTLSPIDSRRPHKC